MRKAIKDGIVGLGIVSIIALIMGVLSAIIEIHFNKDITPFTFFTLGYISCFIFNWRWFNRGEEKK